MALRFVRRALGCAGVLVLVIATPAFAHEQRTIGAYQLTVGWQYEPTYVGVLNAVQIFIHDTSGKPIDDLGTPPSLSVTVTTGTNTSQPLDLEPSFDPDTGLGTHGEFNAAVIPTTPGTYTFHLTGSINGQKLDQRFTSSDSTFDNVADPTAIEFPNPAPTNAELGAHANRLDARVTAAHNKAGSAQTLGLVALIVGIVLGGGGLAVAAGALRRSKRHPV